MKQKLIILFTITLFVLNLQAQELKNSLTIELGGGGLAYSINYENLIKQKFVARAGFSYLLIMENQTEKTLNVITIPLSISYLQNIKSNKHFIEMGIGTMDLITDGDLVEYNRVTNIFINPYLIAGYRYRPIDKKWTFKISLTPFYGTKSLTNPTDQGFMPLGNKIQMWGTIGIGYNF
jgi:hypothetical protein